MASKWISPMHPEIVKDDPGKCDICGMPLVRAETLGFVTPVTDAKKPPLVIPYSAALVPGEWNEGDAATMRSGPRAVPPIQLTVAS